MARHRRVLLLVTLLCAAPAVRAADWPVPRGPSREPAPYTYDPQAWKKVPRAFLDDAPACILHSATNHLVEADGTVETICHEVIRFSGRKGIEKLGEYRNITCTPAYQKLTLNEARVHKADGRTVPTEPGHVQLRDLSTDYQVYDADKQLIISFPSLEVGDAIEVKWTVRGKNPEHGGHFFTRYTFGSALYPVARDDLLVRLPKGKALKFASVGGKLEPAVREEGECRTYHWSATDRPPLPRDDDLPPREELRLQVSISTFGSWDEVGKWKEQVRAGCWECADAVRKVVQDVTKDLKTPQEKARALTYWVRRNIRYVSAGERHDYTPHQPASVLANRYGDCKDQGQLLAVMLREAGVPVALATLGVRGDGQVLEEVPSPWGTHAILLVELDGQQHWIDTTTSLAGWDFLPREDRDRLCYVTPAPQRGEGEKAGLRLLRTPGLTPELNRTEQTTRLWIGADGSTRCSRTSVYHGSAALVQREMWVEVPPGERRRLVTAELQNSISQARLSGLAVDEKMLQNFDDPVRAQVVYEVAGHFSGKSDLEGSISDSKVWSKLLSYNLDPDRKVALDLWSPFESRHRYLFQLPPAYRIDSLPRERTVESKWGSFRLTVKSDPANPRELELEFHTVLEKARVEPADFDAFRQFQEDVARHHRVWLTLEPARDLDETPLLEMVLALAPEDAASATVLARLYLKKERYKDARRVLARARHYRPDEKVLWELTVKAAEDLDAEETAYREMVRRFPTEPSYAVSLGAVLVNLGRQAKAREVLEPLAERGGAAVRGPAHYQLARGWMRQDQPDKALEHLEAAEQADRDSVASVAALLFKGRVCEKLGKAKEAARAYRRALQVRADDEEALTALVRLALAANNRAEALDHLRRYTVSVGDDFDGLLNAAELHLRLERYDDALELASRAREQRFSARTQRVLGLVAAHRGDAAKAVFHLDKADLDADVLEGLIRGHVALGNLREAELRAGQADKVETPTDGLCQAYALTIALVQRRTAVLKGLKVPSGKESVWQQAVNCCVCAEHLHAQGAAAGRVEALLADCFADGIEVGQALALRGLLNLDQGKLTKALADAERAVVLCPQEARGHYVRGRVRLERGDKKALADLKRAAELSQRQDADVLHSLAAALARAGRHEEALAAQREAVSLRPEDKELREQLEKLNETKK